MKFQYPRSSLGVKMLLTKRQQSIKKKLINARNTLRKKLSAIKTSTHEEREYLNKTYKPLIEPLSQIIISKNEHKLENVKKQEPFEMREKMEEEKEEEEEDEVFRPHGAHDQSSYLSEVYKEKDASEQENLFESLAKLPRYYIESMLKDTHNRFDHTYGVYFSKDENWFKVGNKKINFSGDDILVEDRPYEGTRGLYELVFMKRPNHSAITERDLRSYRDILRYTSATHRNFDPTKQINGSKYSKYVNYIKPVMEQNVNYKNILKRQSFTVSTSSSIPSPRTPPSFAQRRSGKGLISKLNVENKPHQYIYWDDVNELIDRLCLLYLQNQIIVPTCRCTGFCR